jgi:hypothetical protein
MAVTEFFVDSAGYGKLFIYSGQFTTTIKQSWDHSRGANRDCEWDGTNTTFCDGTNVKVLLLSGKVTGTIKDSQSTTGWDASIEGTSEDNTNTLFEGGTNNHIYVLSGKITGTLKSSSGNWGSIIGEWNPEGVSADDTNTPFTGNTLDKLFLASGKVTGTLAFS